MTSEITILGLYGLLLIVTILLQAVSALSQVGLMPLLQSRDDMPKLPGIAGRMDRAQLNSAIAMALFAPAVLILTQKGLSTGSTVLAAQIFLIARILYVPAYAFGIAGMRTAAWSAGLFATVWIYLVGLAWV